MRKLVLPLSTALLISLAGCGFEAPAPKRTPPPQTPLPPISTISVSLTVPVNDLAAMLNAKTERQLAQMSGKKVSCFIAKCKMDLIATRTGPITAQARDGGIAVDLPFAVMAHVTLKGGFFKTGGDANAIGEARAFSTLALTPDWRVQTHTHGDVQLSDSHLRLGPINMSVTDLWNHNDEHLSDEIFKQLDKKLGPAIKLKPQAEKLWARVQQPIRVGKKPLSWLVLSPQALRIGRVETVGNALQVSLAADVRGRVVISDTPPPVKPLPLPRPAPLGTPSNAFTFTIPVTLPYDRAAKLALDRLSKRPPHVGSTQIKIQRLEILPSHDDVVVALRFCVAQKWDLFGWFDSCGDGYLRGRPVFDAAANNVRIVNVHYDTGTEDLLLKAMHWLAGDKLAQQLEQHLVFNVAHDMDKLDASVTRALAKPQGKDVVIYGEVQGFGQPTLGWTDKGFLALFTAHGQVHAALNPQKS
ncbi:MAG: DUF4403 family protein [Proteobacteria bacterium]|nr:DUF4403 family protein [Pseudomonadota bacterium]